MSEQENRNLQVQKNQPQDGEMSNEMDIMSALAGYQDAEILDKYKDRLETGQPPQLQGQQQQQPPIYTGAGNQDIVDDNKKAGDDKSVTDNKGNVLNISDLPPEVQELIFASQQEGFDYQKYNERKNKQQEILNLPPKDFLKLYYQSMYGKTEENPNGLTDDEIDEEINSYTPMQLKVQHANLLKEYYSNVEAQKAGVNEQVKTAKQNISKEKENELAANINSVIERNKDREEIAGVAFSEADRKALPEFFKSVVSVDPKTNITLLDQMLKDDDFLYEVVGVIYKMQQGGFKKEINDMKESLKQSIFDKLGLTPEGIGGGSLSVPEGFDATKLL